MSLSAAHCEVTIGVTVCAGKLFNREAASPVKLAYLSSPRFSVSVPFSLSRRSVLHDKARSCRSVRESFLLESPRRKLSTSRCPSALKVTALEIISRSCEFRQKSPYIMRSVQSRVLISSENYPCIELTNYLYLSSLRELQFKHHLIKVRYASISRSSLAKLLFVRINLDRTILIDFYGFFSLEESSVPNFNGASSFLCVCSSRKIRDWLYFAAGNPCFCMRASFALLSSIPLALKRNAEINGRGIIHFANLGEWL